MSAAAAQSPVFEHLDMVRAWAKSLSDLLSQASGAPVTCEVLPRDPENAPSRSEQDIWVTATSRGALSGELSFRLTSADANQFGQKYEANAESSGDTTRKNAVLELFRKAAETVGAELKNAGTDVQFQVASGPAPVWTPAATCYVQANLTTQALVEVVLNEALAASLQAVRECAAIPPVTAESAPGKLGMLMDVELVVTMRFGGRRMLLKDIIDLCTGSVVELDQQVQEPVDLLLDGKLIARGEVVVVDGNYGLRISELVSKPA